MKMLNAWTLEVDEPEIAVTEILEQLNLEKNAMKNSVGILTCSYDYVESGMVKAICDALPFDVIGSTTMTNGNNSEAGTMLLCLTVLTADDCAFAAGKTGSIQQNLENEVNALANGLMSKLDQQAKMALTFMPMFGVGGELMLDALDTSLGGTPIFGTVGCDHDTAEYSNTYTILNGECLRYNLVLLLISGNVSPKYIVASTSEHNLRAQQAVITSSDGCLLKEVNNMPARDYFDSIGLISGRGIEGMSSVPFVVDYGDGTQYVARAIYGLNDDGTATCGGVMPEGGTLYIGRMDVEDVLLTAETSTNELLAKDDITGIILFPCLGRNMVLGLDPIAEVDVVKNTINDKVPWHLAYSAGEICPMYMKDGKLINRFHNFTFIGCAL